MERNWAAVQRWLGRVLVDRGVDRISAEELTVPPGLDELFSLLQVKRHHEEEAFDVVVVDCAPTGETLRLLSFPDVARWWLEKVVPQQGSLMAAARPLARAVLDVSLPGEEVLEDVQRLVTQPHRDERDPARHQPGLRAAGDDPGPDGHRRGQADLHLPQPLRLPDRRGDRQPRLPRAGRRLLRCLARAPAGGAARRRGRVRAGPRPARPVLRRGGRRARDARPSRRRALRGPRRCDGPARARHRAARPSATAARACASTCRSRRRGRSR